MYMISRLSNCIRGFKLRVKVMWGIIEELWDILSF